MANLPEVVQYDAGIYQIETTDPVLGGVNGTTNIPLKNLANRTAYLKKHVDDLESGVTLPPGTATETYVQNELAKLPTKKPVRVATTANITLSGTQTIDGLAVQVGDRVLVKNQTNAAQNGIYVVAASAWTRATDADSATEVYPNITVEVSEGTLQADTTWRLTNNGSITLGTTLLAFARIDVTAFGLGGAAALVPGNNIDDNTIPTGFYYVVSETSRTKPADDDGYGHLIVSREGNGLTVCQLYLDNTTNRIWTRTWKPSQWSGWVEIYHSDNLGGAFKGANQSLASNGYQKLPGGLILQWGGVVATSGNAVLTYPIAFPSGRVTSLQLTDAGPTCHSWGFSGGSASGINVHCKDLNNGVPASSSVSWIAIGY